MTQAEQTEAAKVEAVDAAIQEAWRQIRNVPADIPACEVRIAVQVGFDAGHAAALAAVPDDAQEAVENLKQVIDDLHSGEIMGDGYYKPSERNEIANSLSLLAHARSAEPWVKVEDGLPDADVGVLARFQYRTGEQVTAIMAHRRGVWFFSDSTGETRAYMLRGDKVIAWMPIPPYRGGSNE